MGLGSVHRCWTFKSLYISIIATIWLYIPRKTDRTRHDQFTDHNYHQYAAGDISLYRPLKRSHVSAFLISTSRHHWGPIQFCRSFADCFFGYVPLVHDNICTVIWLRNGDQCVSLVAGDQHLLQKQTPSGGRFLMDPNRSRTDISSICGYLLTHDLWGPRNCDNICFHITAFISLCHGLSASDVSR